MDRSSSDTSSTPSSLSSLLPASFSLSSAPAQGLLTKRRTHFRIAILSERFKGEFSLSIFGLDSEANKLPTVKEQIVDFPHCQIISLHCISGEYYIVAPNRIVIQSKGKREIKVEEKAPIKGCISLTIQNQVLLLLATETDAYLYDLEGHKRSSLSWNNTGTFQTLCFCKPYLFVFFRDGINVYLLPAPVPIGRVPIPSTPQLCSCGKRPTVLIANVLLSIQFCVLCAAARLIKSYSGAELSSLISTSSSEEDGLIKKFSRVSHIQSQIIRISNENRVVDIEKFFGIDCRLLLSLFSDVDPAMPSLPKDESKFLNHFPKLIGHSQSLLLILVCMHQSRSFRHVSIEQKQVGIGNCR